MVSKTSGLPPELWSQIFSLSCVDDGITGRSLSSVSHQFRRLSSRYRYQSLALITARHIIHFSTLISQLEKSDKRVLYLFIHYPHPSLDASEDVDDPDFVMDSWSSSSSSSHLGLEGHTSAQLQSIDTEEAMNCEEEFIGAEEQTQLLAEATAYLESLEHSEADDDDDDMDEPTEIRHREMDEADEAVASALYALLQNVGDTLKILSLVWTSLQPRLIEELLPPLPTLLELYISREYTEAGAMEPTTDDPVHCLFPSIQYLRIAGYVEKRPEAFAAVLAALAPRLTYLRIPSYFFLGDDQSDDSPFTATPFDGLILERSPVTPPNSRVPFSVTDRRALSKLFGISEQSDAPQPHTLYVFRTAEDRDAVVWMSQWLERVSGGSGCWGPLYCP
ncbi:hypothetical protein BKA70DRAFT_1366359 [Coprinopsis sp. MPI-PUGE-AT-0042]|nr:hypothetical protein BKA70DRAFT_1366359 [Coprinopsis sp. MPI-PUGE-AT-0042]